VITSAQLKVELAMRGLKLDPSIPRHDGAGEPALLDIGHEADAPAREDSGTVGQQHLDPGPHQAHGRRQQGRLPAHGAAGERREHH
jgi:hypothetical protein